MVLPYQKRLFQKVKYILNYFQKKLQNRCSTGFWIRLWKDWNFQDEFKEEMNLIIRSSSLRWRKLFSSQSGNSGLTVNNGFFSAYCNMHSNDIRRHFSVHCHTKTGPHWTTKFLLDTCFNFLFSYQQLRQTNCCRSSSHNGCKGIKGNFFWIFPYDFINFYHFFLVSAFHFPHKIKKYGSHLSSYDVLNRTVNLNHRGPLLHDPLYPLAVT